LRVVMACLQGKRAVSPGRDSARFNRQLSDNYTAELTSATAVFACTSQLISHLQGLLV
jgi:hypothetical protein